MTAQEFLPTQPKALPTELPLEISSHAEHGKSSEHKHEESHRDENYEQYALKTLLSWHAPGRPFRKRGKEYYLSVLLIAMLLEIVAFLFAQQMLMLAIAALVFFSFVLVSVPPVNFHYRITNQGITIEDHCFLWEELYDFYFKKRDGETIVHVRTHSMYPGEIKLVLGDINPDQIRGLIIRFLPYREVIARTFMDKSADWLSHNFPLEKA